MAAMTIRIPWSRKSLRSDVKSFPQVVMLALTRTLSYTHRTATADGQYMAKILSTFSKMEQSRFEAFKRVSFPCNAISRYVAHCLAERQQPLRQAHESSNPNPTKVLAGPTGPPQLQDLVVPGHDEEITTVVATLAKAYAQRLCAAAKAQQKQGGSTTGGEGAEAPLQPEHVLQAFYARKQQGQDPGFFLQPNESITLGTQNDSSKEQMKRVAALSAQDEFDRVFEDYKEFVKKNPPQKEQAKPPPAAAAASKKDDDSDSDSGDEVEMDLEAELEKEMES